MATPRILSALAESGLRRSAASQSRIAETHLRMRTNASARFAYTSGEGSFWMTRVNLSTASSSAPDASASAAAILSSVN